MLRALTWAGAGLAVGVLITMLLRPTSEPWAVDAAPSSTVAPGADPLAAEERAIFARRLGAVEARVAELVDELEALRATAGATAGASVSVVPLPASRALAASPNGIPPATLFSGATPQFMEQSVDPLVAGGFTPERAEWIRRRTDELLMQGMQARYEAERNGEPPPRDDLFDPTLQMRQELGDVEYERYLTALGRPTGINVMSVVGDSPAAEAGLHPGDQIVSYAGRRVFDVRDLNPLILDGTPGEPVVIEVDRDGGRLQLVVPRGPLGISGGIGNATGPIRVVPMRSLPPQ